MNDLLPHKNYDNLLNILVLCSNQFFHHIPYIFISLYTKYASTIVKYVNVIDIKKSKGNFILFLFFVLKYLLESVFVDCYSVMSHSNYKFSD